MCGFAGFIDFQERQQPQQYWEYLTQMGRQLLRRGPDEEQVLNSPPLWLVFRRLSIIDVAGGTQPIWNEDNTMFVVVNGEIYNHLELRSQLREHHHFRTKSDAEIVLHLYEELGPKALGACQLCKWRNIPHPPTPSLIGRRGARFLASLSLWERDLG